MTGDDECLRQTRLLAQRWLQLRLLARTAFWVGMGVLLEWVFLVATVGTASGWLPVAGVGVLGAAVALHPLARREWRRRPRMAPAVLPLAMYTLDWACVVVLVLLMCSLSSYPSAGITRAVVLGVFFGIVASASAVRAWIKRSALPWVAGVGPELASVGLLTAVYSKDFAVHPMAVAITAATVFTFEVIAFGLVFCCLASIRRETAGGGATLQGAR